MIQNIHSKPIYFCVLLMVTEFAVTHLFLIIISLFQDDNIFGMSASLTYGPQIQICYKFLSLVNITVP